MSELYPLQFTSILKEKIWGGEKLRTVFGKSGAGKHTGESWEISAVPGDVSTVANGPLKGKTIQQLIGQYGEALLGTALTDHAAQFPLLLKYIDAADNLSVQVHPGDQLARKRHSSSGKTEMWYIIDADPGAELILGFTKAVTEAEYVSRLQDGSLMRILRRIPVKSGDAFYVPAGRVHGIGRGILLAEIQQTADITYRLYDYDRVDASGQTRELHADLAREAINFLDTEAGPISYHATVDQPVELVRSEYFSTSVIQCRSPLSRETRGDSFVAYMIIAGKVVIRSSRSGNYPFAAGEAVLVPASFGSYTLDPSQSATVLEIKL
ncbi:MAG: class I mannose-6-phosphate isomerase [bacterium]|nr:class I mannose-6-phosphate isomerase [bacterium]